MLRPSPRTMLTATGLNVITMLNAAELLAIAAPEARPRIILRIRLPDQSPPRWRPLRKARISATLGADNLTLQGQLVAGDVIAKAGLSAQPKARPKAP